MVTLTLNVLTASPKVRSCVRVDSSFCAQTLQSSVFQLRAFRTSLYSFLFLINSRNSLSLSLEETNMPWQAAPSLIIIVGAFNVAAGLIWTVDRVHLGKVRSV